MNNFPFNKKRWEHYKLCQKKYIEVGDCDPAYPILKYIANKHNLSIEERFWLAFLYSACYSSPTAWAMFNTMPKYNNITEFKLIKWWGTYKPYLLFCTDRAKVKNFDKLVPMLLSYKKLIGEDQQRMFQNLKGNIPEETYEKVYKYLGNIYYVGRFSLFLITEIINVLTDFPMTPNSLDLSNAESCRNGLCYAIGADNWIHFHGKEGKNWKGLTTEQYDYLYKILNRLVKESKVEYPNLNISYWNVETTLCAYKKYYWKSRYIGYYIDRQQTGLIAMERKMPELTKDWNLFWEARKATLDNRYLGELHNWVGIRKEKMGLPHEKELK